MNKKEREEIRSGRRIEATEENIKIFLESYTQEIGTVFKCYYRKHIFCISGIVISFASNYKMTYNDHNQNNSDIGDHVRYLIRSTKKKKDLIVRLKESDLLKKHTHFYEENVLVSYFSAYTIIISFSDILNNYNVNVHIHYDTPLGIYVGNSDKERMEKLLSSKFNNIIKSTKNELYR